MNLFTKEPKCIHHWHYVGKETIYTNNGSVDVDEMNGLFCPKCEKEMAVTDERWHQLQEIQKVRESYSKSASPTPTPTVKMTRKKGTSA